MSMKKECKFLLTETPEGVSFFGLTLSAAILLLLDRECR